VSKKISSYSHHTRDPVLTPERKLWRAALEQAREDAELPLFADGTEPIERISARHYLRADTAEDREDLKLVCDFAEVPFDRVALWARNRYPLAA
jgi:hypothetical protein